jgi:hypothetical protein
MAIKLTSVIFELVLIIFGGTYIFLFEYKFTLLFKLFS